MSKIKRSKKVEEVRINKIKPIEIRETWKKGWCTPDVFVRIDQEKDWTYDNMILLRGHVDGESPLNVFYDTK